MGKARVPGLPAVLTQISPANWLFRADGRGLPGLRDGVSCPGLNAVRLYRVPGYKRALSQSELRQIRRAKMRVVICCATVTFFALTGVAGLICLIYASKPH